MNTFDTNKFRSELDMLAKETMSSCRLVYELYQRRLSAAIDNFVAGLPEEQQTLAFELACQEFDYRSAEEITDEICRDTENGYCCYGLDRNCCPLGCGDLDYY